MSHFIKAAFVPAVVAVPLAVGYLLINAGAQQIGAAGMDGFKNMIEIPVPIIAGVDTLWQIVWLFMSLMIMYTGVFSAVQAMNYEGGLGEFQGRQIQKIQDTGRVARGIATQAAGLLPVPMAGGMTVGQALGAISPRGISEALRKKAAGESGKSSISRQQEREAVKAATSAQAPGAAISTTELQNRVRLAGSGGAAELRSLKDALRQLNPALRADTLSGQQMVDVLRHIEQGPHQKRISLNIDTHAAGILRGAAGGASPPATPPPATPPTTP